MGRVGCTKAQKQMLLDINMKKKYTYGEKDEILYGYMDVGGLLIW